MHASSAVHVEICVWLALCLQEPATADNPPMLLPCGHVLSHGSVTKLARGSRNVRFKCPYCPLETTAGMAKALHLC